GNPQPSEPSAARARADLSDGQPRPRGDRPYVRAHRHHEGRPHPGTADPGPAAQRRGARGLHARFRGRLRPGGAAGLRNENTGLGHIMTTLLNRIARRAAGGVEVDAAARRAAEQAIADTLACMVAGQGDTASQAVRRAMAGPEGPADLVGGGRAPAATAALING